MLKRLPTTWQLRFAARVTDAISQSPPTCVRVRLDPNLAAQVTKLKEKL